MRADFRVFLPPDRPSQASRPGGHPSGCGATRRVRLRRFGAMWRRPWMRAAPSRSRLPPAAGSRWPKILKAISRSCGAGGRANSVVASPPGVPCHPPPTRVTDAHPLDDNRPAL